MVRVHKLILQNLPRVSNGKTHQFPSLSDKRFFPQPHPMKSSKLPKWILWLLALAFLWIAYPCARVAFFLISDPIPDEKPRVEETSFIDDASGMNQTRHSGILELPADFNQSVSLLRLTLAHALREGKKIIPFGARHSMGKQSLKENAIHVNLRELRAMRMEDGLLRVQAGARWSQVIEFLAPQGLAPEVMQSNADFSIGGTLSVNAHGWQPGRPPVSSTVEKIRILTADGILKTCSRTENQDLFRHAIGGYGMMGIILEAWIRPVRNEILRSSHEITTPSEFLNLWVKMKKEPVRLAFGRLSVAPNSFFERILLVSYVSTDETSRSSVGVKTGFATSLSRAIFRASLGSERGKNFRSLMEGVAGGEAGGTHPRANLLFEPVRIFANNDPDKIDLLLEIFIPQEKFSDFVPIAAHLLRNRSDELLNVTVREIARDTDSALPYAKEKVFGLVMLFTLDRTVNAEKKFGDLNRDLIECALDHGGTFYLPYRNHASSSQLNRAYPELDSFLAAKGSTDPQSVFASGFHDYLLAARKEPVGNP